MNVVGRSQSVTLTEVLSLMCRALHPAVLPHTGLVFLHLLTLPDDIKYTRMYTSLMHQLSLPPSQTGN